MLAPSPRFLLPRPTLAATDHNVGLVPKDRSIGTRPGLGAAKGREMSELEVTILYDTREPFPHPWEPYLSRPMIRGTLETGDFSLPGCGEWIVVERKTLDDLIGCLTTSRERFTRELQRAARIKDFYVVIEASYSDLSRGRYTSGMNPKSAWESVIALQQRYGIPFLFAGSQELAARLTESILTRWWREHSKVMETAIKASRKATAATKRSA